MPAIIWVILALLGFLVLKKNPTTATSKPPVAATPTTMFNGIAKTAQAAAQNETDALTKALSSALGAASGKTSGGASGGSSGGSSKSTQASYPKDTADTNPLDYNANLQDQSTVFGGNDFNPSNGQLDFNSNLQDESTVFGGPATGGSDNGSYYAPGGGPGDSNVFGDTSGAGSGSGIDLSGSWGGADLSTGYTGDPGYDGGGDGGDGGDGGGD